MEVTVSKLNKFLMFKLPSAYLCGVRLKEMNDLKSMVHVRHKWINQNPFRSLYFAVHSMAAELSTGCLVIKKIQASGKPISMLVTSHKGTFSKKAVGKIQFRCLDGALIDEAVQQTIATGDGQKFVMKSVGKDEAGDVVSEYEFEWSIKLKSKK